MFRFNLHLTSLFLAMALGLSAAAFGAGGFYSGTLKSFAPTSFKVGQTSAADLKFTNTGVSGYFSAEIISAPGGWTVTPTVTDRIIVEDEKDGKFTFQVTVPASESPGADREITIRLYAWEIDQFPFQTDQQTYTIHPLLVPQPFTTTTPAHLSSGYELPILFAWNASAYAATYTAEFFQDVSGFPATTPFLKVTGLTSTSFNMTSDILIGGENLRLPPGTPIHWKITAINAVGQTVNTGGDSIFITKARDPLGEFHFVSPPANAILNPNPSFEWTESAGAVLYELLVLPDVNGHPREPAVLTVQLMGSTNTRFDWGSRPGLAPGNYFVFVGAFNENHNQPVDGGPRPFSTTNLGTFNLTAPAADLKDVSDQPLFQWQHALGTQQYYFELVLETPNAYIPVFSTTIPNAATLYQWTGKPLTRGLTYWWQVTAIRNSERRLNADGPRKFTVHPLGAFSAIAPKAGTTGVARKPTFDWQGSSGAKNYVVEVAPSDQGVPDTANGVNSGSLSPGTLRWTATFAELNPGKDYFWRVRALDSTVPAEEIDREGWQVFTTTPLTSFSLRTPANGATSVSRTPTLTWDPINGVLYYRVLITAPGLGTLPALQTAGNVGSLTVPTGSALNGDTAYTWTVEAVGPNGTQLADQTFGFTTTTHTQATRDDVLAAILGKQLLSNAERAAFGLSPTDTISIATILPVTN